MTTLHERFRASLPQLTAENYRVTSEATWDYNCIAWAAGMTDDWWWPADGRFWPGGVPREETMPAFIAAFGTLGYSPGATANLEFGMEKVALFALDGKPTHAARQLTSGWWTSALSHK